MLIAFSKWSPGGNTTLFLPANAVPMTLYASVAKQLLPVANLAVEQAGFIDPTTHTLTMAGQEFCLNATAAFAAELLANAQKDFLSTTLTCSGWPFAIDVEATGTLPFFSTNVYLPLPECPVEQICPGIMRVTLPGITHLLLSAEKIPKPDLPAFKAILHQFAPEDAPCVGAIFWEEQAHTLRITPLVYVRAVNSYYLESACGSGSLALAIALAKNTPCSIAQPSGATLTIAISDSCAHIRGNVTYIAHGQVWVDPYAA